MSKILLDLSNDKLIYQTKALVHEERRIQVEVLLHLKEIERRKLFLDLGYGSLFEFTKTELGYSESAAYRRIQAMRLMKAVPELEQKISTGTITLTTAAQMQTFLKFEKKQNVAFTVDQTKSLVESLENKSSREVEKQLLSLRPADQIPSEKTRAIDDVHTEIKLVIPDQLKQKLDQLRLLLSHVNPEMNYQQLLQYLTDKALAQLNPVNKLSRKATPAPQSKTTKDTRHISAALKTAIWKRDQGCCTFVSPENKKICGSKFQIQIDHIKPFALGGATEFSNLRLLCSSHNRWRAQKTFGKSYWLMRNHGRWSQ